MVGHWTPILWIGCSMKKVWLQPGVRKEWLSPRTCTTLPVCLQTICSGHTCSLSPCQSWERAEPLKNPLLIKDVCPKVTLTCECSLVVVYSPLQASKPNHLAPVPNFKKERRPRPQIDCIPKFSMINFSRKMVYNNSFSQKRST